MQRSLKALLVSVALTATTTIAANAQTYGYYGLPQGSYQRSCSNAQVRGSVLSASCSAPNGQQRWSSLDVNRCNGGDITNNNGRLSCANYGYNSGYGYGNTTYGRNRGDDDDNDNDNGRGHHRDRGRGNGGYNNGNGRGNGYGYGNGGYPNNGYGYGLPGGSWQQSCQNGRVNGSVLSATCAGPNGGWINSSINLNNCSNANDVYNRNGYLGC